MCLHILFIRLTSLTDIAVIPAPKPPKKVPWLRTAFAAGATYAVACFPALIRIGESYYQHHASTLSALVAAGAEELFISGLAISSAAMLAWFESIDEMKRETFLRPWLCLTAIGALACSLSWFFIHAPTNKIEDKIKAGDWEYIWTIIVIVGTFFFSFLTLVQTRRARD